MDMRYPAIPATVKEAVPGARLVWQGVVCRVDQMVHPVAQQPVDQHVHQMEAEELDVNDVVTVTKHFVNQRHVGRQAVA